MLMISKNILAFVIGGWLCCPLTVPLFGQAAAPVAPDRPAPSATASQDLNRKLFAAQASPALPARQDYRLGPGDVVDVSVFDIKDLNRTLEISAQGKITLPFINDV